MQRGMISVLINYNNKEKFKVYAITYLVDFYTNQIC